MRSSDQTTDASHSFGNQTKANSNKVAPTPNPKSGTAGADTKITPPISRASFNTVVERGGLDSATKMEEESIAIVSTNTSDASSISSLSGGSVSTSSSSSSLQTAAFSNAGKVTGDESKANEALVFSIDERVADIDKTPVSYELSLSMYDGLLETCRPFYFPSDRKQEETSSSSNTVHKIPPRLEDSLEMQNKEARLSSLTLPRRKRASPTHHLDDNDKYGGRKVRVKTITFQEPYVAGRKKFKSYK